MDNSSIIIPLLIYGIIPVIGGIAYWFLVQKIKKEQITQPPIPDLLVTFLTYGGLLLVLLTSVFWKWSGMASIGSAYLLLAAPIIMGIIAYRNHTKREVSPYHNGLFWAGSAYLLIIVIAFLGSLALPA
ncbi:MAG: hypothetical protein AB8F95_08460 [Bacteroidia bacterium]